MNQPLIVVLFILMAAAVAEEADPVAKFLKELGDDDYASREAAEKALIAYIAARPGDFMELGHRLILYGKNGDPEVQKRLGNVLRSILNVTGPGDEYLAQDYGEGKSYIQGLPVLVLLRSTARMFRFCRTVLSANHLGLSIPRLDFEEWLLVSVEVTKGIPPGYEKISAGSYFKSAFCRRDFEKKETIFSSALGEFSGEPWERPKTSPGCVEYKLHVNDLPFRMTFAPVRGELTGAEVTLRYQVTEASWRDVEKILKESNLYAFRKLAETCDATIPAETRRSFLQKAYMIDPLLPYVMFTHLAQKHPDLFKQDYDYWKDKAPDADKSRVVGALFRAALEEGKKIVEKKEIITR